MAMTDNHPTSTKSYGAAGGFTGQATGYIGPDAPAPAVGLEYANIIIERTGKYLIAAYEALNQKHTMIYGPVPKAVSDQKMSGGSGLIYELSRLSDAAEEIARVASSL